MLLDCNNYNYLGVATTRSAKVCFSPEASVNRELARPLALVGMPGCGKSSLAAALARSLGIDFFDSDQLVEQKSGTTIADIFAKNGEAHFRKLECGVISELARDWAEKRIKPFVLASGGGAMANPHSHKVLQKHFTTVWLDCPLDVLQQRLVRQRDDKKCEGQPRPLLKGKEADGLKARLQALLDARRRSYAVADRRLAISEDDSITRLVSRLRKLMVSRATPRREASIRESTNQEKISLSLPTGSYDILVGAGLLDKASDVLLKHAGVSDIIIVVERKLVHHAEALRSNLQARARKVVIVSILVSESRKTLRTAERLCHRLSSIGADRDSLIVVIGGGVLCDIAAFAASIFMRGVSFALLPTTLLAQVDAAIGGKNGVNSEAGKNMLGVFSQPKVVLCDTDFLSTLPARHMRCGYAEILKYALIVDAPFFAWLEEHGAKLFVRDPKALTYAIAHSVRIKSRLVEQDERDQSGQRALLNLGHTFGHALEKLSCYRVAHGEAVAFGCLLAFRFAVALARCKSEAAESLAQHLRGCGLPTRLLDLQIDESQHVQLRDSTSWVSAMSDDKKRLVGALRLVLPNEIGACALQEPMELKTLSKMLAPLLQDI